MANTIRTSIIAALLTRAGEILTTKGFETAVGTNTFLASKPNKKLPAVVIKPGRESVSQEYGANVCEMPVDITGFMDPGGSDAEVVSEKILADLIEAYTGTEIVYSFNTGESEIAVGDTVTGAASGATGYVVAVSVTSGAWGDGDAAGTFTVRRDDGLFQSAETVTVGGTACATIAGATGYNPGDLAAGGLAESIVYQEGGADEWPEDGETVTGSSARFLVTYQTKTGNPYSQH